MNNKLIDGFIRTAVQQGNRGPDEITKAIAPDLDGEDEEWLFEYGLRDYVAKRLAGIRAETRKQARSGPGSNAYANIRRRIDSGEYQVMTADGYKALRDCTADDVDWMAARSRAAAARILAAAERYADLAEHMRANNVERVGDLDDATLADHLGGTQ